VRRVARLADWIEHLIGIPNTRQMTALLQFCLGVAIILQPERAGGVVAILRDGHWLILGYGLFLFAGALALLFTTGYQAYFWGSTPMLGYVVLSLMNAWRNGLYAGLVVNLGLYLLMLRQFVLYDLRRNHG